MTRTILMLRVIVGYSSNAALLHSHFIVWYLEPHSLTKYETMGQLSGYKV